jgi:peptidyl-prolyl cis-trans isomerase C
MTRFTRSAFLFAVVSAAFLGGTTSAGFGPGGQDAQTSATEIVAEVGGRSILVADLEAKLIDERRRALAEKRLDSFAAGAREKTLGRLIETKRLALMARESKLADRPDVKRQIDNLVDDLLAAVFVAEAAGRVPQTGEALRAYYEAHLDEFTEPGRVRARHIVVKSQAEAVALRGKLVRNADFARLADELNVDSTKGKGGELGWIRRGAMVPAFDHIVFGLKVGEIGPIVQTSYGFHIAQVEEIEAAKPKPYETVVATIRKKIVDREVESLKAELAQKHPARINNALLGSLR